MSTAATPSLTVLAMGRVEPHDLASLRGRFPVVEQIDLPLPGDAEAAAHAAVINRAVDAAHAPWILILRERESIGEDLAREIGHAATENPSAWAFRVRSQPWYSGAPLRLGREDDGEIRLFHRRRARIDPSSPRGMTLQGTVIRIRSALRRETFSSTREHEAYLRMRGVPHSIPRRTLLFFASWLRARGWRSGRAGTIYLWIESGFDLTDPGTGVSKR